MDFNLFKFARSSFTSGTESFMCHRHNNQIVPFGAPRNLAILRTGAIANGAKQLLKIEADMLITQIWELGATVLRDWTFAITMPELTTQTLTILAAAQTKLGVYSTVQAPLWQPFLLPEGTKVEITGNQNASSFQIISELVHVASYQEFL
jgi:hypothetical protein